MKLYRGEQIQFRRCHAQYHLIHTMYSHTHGNMAPPGTNPSQASTDVAMMMLNTLKETEKTTIPTTHMKWIALNYFSKCNVNRV